MTNPTVWELSYTKDHVTQVCSALRDYLRQNGLGVGAATNGQFFVYQDYYHENYVFNSELPEYFDTPYEAYTAALKWLEKLK